MTKKIHKNISSELEYNCNIENYTYPFNENIKNV